MNMAEALIDSLNDSWEWFQTFVDALNAAHTLPRHGGLTISWPGRSPVAGPLKENPRTALTDVDPSYRRILVTGGVRRQRLEFLG